MDKRFYVYAHYKPNDLLVPFYIGKGTKKHMFVNALEYYGVFGR